MYLNRFLVLLLLLAGCTSGHKQHIENVAVEEYSEEYYSLHENHRNIASAGPGMAYSAPLSFRMNDFKGTTYITFLKERLKPALDSLSDKRNGGGGGFRNIGASAYVKNASFMDPRVLVKYKGAKWNSATRKYVGGLSDAQVETAYETLKKVKPISTVDSLGYYDAADKAWFTKNDMALALKEANINSAPFDLATLYALTSGVGVKVKIDDYNYNYHVLYKTGKTNPRVEVMSGRSFASSPSRNVGDATDPEYLRDLDKYFKESPDKKPFYRALILALANSDASGWPGLSAHGQLVLSDFLTVYTAEAVRHLMVNLQSGLHPWEIDLAAVTFVSAVSHRIGKVVVNGVLTPGDSGKWFAPSPHNVPGKPQRSGIGITRKDRKIFQKAIHDYEMGTKDGKLVIQKIQSIVGTKNYSYDVIQAVFEFLTNPQTPRNLGANGVTLANLMAQFIEMAEGDAAQIAATIK